MSLPSEQVCKGCSLVVQPGYPKCPRCKMPLPKFEGPLATATRASQVQGGTAIEAESGSGILLIGGALVAAGVLLAVLTLGGDDSEQRAKASQVESSGNEVQATSTQDQPNNPEIGFSKESETPSPEDLQARAIADLEEVLSNARLWATVSLDDASEGTISVVSSACEQGDMQPTLLSAAAPLKEVGFTTIICVAKHGAQVFELPL